MSARPEVKRAVVSVLQGSDRPLKREALLDRVSDALWADPSSTVAHTWTRATLSRRMREAIVELFGEGTCIVSDGSGFRIATTWSEREEGLRRKKRMALSLLREIAMAEKIPLEQAFRQVTLFEAEEGVA